jgi:phage gpG-like protein
MGSAVLKVEGFESYSRFFADATAFQKEEFAEFVAGEAKAITEKAFSEEKDPVTGAAWPAHSDATFWIYSGRGSKKATGGSKAVRALNGALLVQRGQLKSSIGTETFPDGSVLIGSNKVYSRIHNEGGRMNGMIKSVMPQRRFLGVDSGFFSRVFEDNAVRKLFGFGE